MPDTLPSRIEASSGSSSTSTPSGRLASQSWKNPGKSRKNAPCKRRSCHPLIGGSSGDGLSSIRDNQSPTSCCAEVSSLTSDRSFFFELVNSELRQLPRLHHSSALYPSDEPIARTWKNSTACSWGRCTRQLTLTFTGRTTTRRLKLSGSATPILSMATKPVSDSKASTGMRRVVRPKADPDKLPPTS